MAAQVEATLRISAEDRTAKAFAALEGRIEKAQKAAADATRKEKQLAAIERAEEKRRGREALMVERAREVRSEKQARREERLRQWRQRADWTQEQVERRRMARRQVFAEMTARFDAQDAVTRERRARREAMYEQRVAAIRERNGGGVGLLTAGAIVTAGVAKAVAQYAGFERTLSRIGITAGATAGQTEALQRKVYDLAQTYAMSRDSVIQGLDTLVSSGMSLDEAMAFLPSVLLTAQATGAATTDIANTAIKAASALKLQASDLQAAFDIMVAGGKAGQFELRDMAQFIPELANSFASLGYTGNEGLKRLIAVLQTLRERTGDAGAAATQAQNIFGKMYSEETAKRFSKFGINLRAEMLKAQKVGEDALSAFIRLSREALKGDMTKLPLLFSDQEFRQGMQTLISAPDALKKFLDAVNGADVQGSAFRDFSQIAADTQAKIDGLTNSLDRLWISFGKYAAPGVIPFAEGAASLLDQAERGAKKREYWQKAMEGVPLWQQPFLSDDDVRQRMRAQGWQPEADFQQKVLGRRIAPPKSGAPGSLAFMRDDPEHNPGRGGARRYQRPIEKLIDSGSSAPPPSSIFGVQSGTIGPPRRGKLNRSSGAVVEDAADKLRQAMEAGGGEMRSAGTDSASAIRDAAQELRDAANSIAEGGRQAAAAISGAKVQVPSQGYTGPVGRGAYKTGPNANLGQSMPNAGRLPGSN